MQLPTPTSSLAETIQLSITPVFLLSAVGVFLGVLVNRLARIVDRQRVLDGAVRRGTVREGTKEEQLMLDRRTRLILQAIRMFTYSAVLIASVTAALFLGTFARIDVTAVVGIAFVAAMGALIVGLLNFLREVHVALRWVREMGPGPRPTAASLPFPSFRLGRSVSSVRRRKPE